MLRVVTPNVTGATSKMPNVYAGCYGVTGLAPQEGGACLQPPTISILILILILILGTPRSTVIIRSSRNRTGYEQLAPVLSSSHHKRKSRQVEFPPHLSKSE